MHSLPLQGGSPFAVTLRFGPGAPALLIDLEDVT